MIQLRTFAALAVCAAGVATATVLPTSFSPQDAEMQEMEMPKPTKVHEALLSGVGEWVGTLESEYPGTPAMTVDATETVTALGPFHILADFQCDFMGMPYKGHGIMGYDAETKEVYGTWTDNMNPLTSFMKGSMDLDKDVLEMHYEAPVEPGGPKLPHRNLTERTKDAYTTTFYMGEGDSEIQIMKISMKRKK